MLRLNMQIRDYLIKNALISIRFQSRNLNIRSSQVQNFLFHFVDILEIFTKRILDIYFYYSINQTKINDIYKEDVMEAK